MTNATIHTIVRPFSDASKGRTAGWSKGWPKGWAGAWDDLAARVAEPNPFHERWFIEAGLAHLPPPDGARLLVVEAEGAWIGVLPLARGRRYARLPIRHSVTLTHPHHLLGTPLVAKGQEERFWRAALAALDQAPGSGAFLHLTGLTQGPVLAGLHAVRRADIVHSYDRALLAHGLSAEAYYATHVRAKKRKELRRQSARLAEQGALSWRRFGAEDRIETWIADYLRLERSGWKGAAGSALDCRDDTRAFFTQAITGGAAQGRLQWLRLDLDGAPIAMMVNWLCPPGAFTYKIAYDERFARFSPGVLIEVENLAILNDPTFAWTDSCAVADHPMIDHLWAERRRIVRVSVPLNGGLRRPVFAVARALEKAADVKRSA